MEKITTIISVFALSFMLVSCVTSPKQQVKNYESAIKHGRMDSALNMLEQTDNVDAEELQYAIRNDRLGKLPDSDAWLHSKTSAKVIVGGQSYLLIKSGNSWKISCASIGPYHNRTPEMTLLLAIHLIRGEKFDEFLSLAPSELEIDYSLISDEFIKDLQTWANEVAFLACEPFIIAGDEARINYGNKGSKTIRMQLENGYWRIKDLW